MAFASILRKSANSLAPLALRLARVQRNYHSCIFTALNQGLRPQQPAVNRFFPNAFRFSSAAVSRKPSSDESLIRVLESEIQCAEEEDAAGQVEGTPSGFPFEIEDTPGMQTITLTREYNGELIKVDVHMIDHDDEPEDSEEDGRDDYEKENNVSIPLVVTVTKKDGTSLEFSCTASPDQVAIDSLIFRGPTPEDELAYEGPDFHDLDENMQNSFHKYLEIRGIKPSTTNFLHGYMMNKDNREYANWLKNLKKFVEA